MQCGKFPTFSSDPSQNRQTAWQFPDIYGEVPLRGVPISPPAADDEAAGEEEAAEGDGEC